ncbi:hypothetical protein BLNAU_9075 [Blattamonas nauphoetae]|uniref:C2H2-type domain-containing protein n=1 Tax=Blattamonas nauphoetae TaxID=2049346 RepID=A0ABQ9XWR4_9EUKA|nr:hypothetical protein BLNAU_9075 [Blattamonas nauphoetae]
MRTSIFPTITSEIARTNPFTEETFNLLKDHEKLHTGEKPYQCSFLGCGQAFTTSSYLSRHERLHTEQQQFHCTFPDFGMTSADESALRPHERLRTEEKQFTCTYPGCGRAFTQQYAVRMHEFNCHRLHLPTRLSRGSAHAESEDEECSVAHHEVLSMCRFCASSVLKDDVMECVKCGECCHFSCASQRSLFVASAVRAVDFELFLCDSCFGKLSPSCLAELLFPHSASVVLHHTSVSLDGSCIVLRPLLSHPFSLVLAPSHHSSLAGSLMPLGVSGVIVPDVSSTAVFTRSDGVHLDTSRSPLASCRIRRSLECGNCVGEDGEDEDGTPIIAVYALRDIENEELVLWERREKMNEGDSAVASDEIELGKCECGIKAGTVEHDTQEATTRREDEREDNHNLREMVIGSDDSVSDETDPNTARASIESRMLVSLMWLEEEGTNTEKRRVDSSSN